METTQQNSQEELLLHCCEKRQKLYALLQRSLEEDSRDYDEEMRQLHQEIDKIMARISE